MDKNKTQLSQNFGLSNHEATIYTTLLKINKLSISDISRLSGLKRTTCYEYIDSLLKKDYIIRVPVGKRMYYSAENPQKVLELSKQRFTSFEKTLANLSQVYDETSNKPKIVFYEGKREIKKIYEDLFGTVGDVYSIFPPKAFFENFTLEEYNEFDKQISENKFKSKDLIIYDSNFKEIEKIRNNNGSENKITKKLPDTFKTNVDVLIFGNKVALVSLRDLSATVIENGDIAELFKSLHSYIWKHA